MIQDTQLIPNIDTGKEETWLIRNCGTTFLFCSSIQNSLSSGCGEAPRLCAFPWADILLALPTPWHRGMWDSRRNLKRLGAGGKQEGSRSRSQLQSVRNPWGSPLKAKQAAGLIRTVSLEIAINTSDTLRKSRKGLRGGEARRTTKTYQKDYLHL